MHRTTRRRCMRFREQGAVNKISKSQNTKTYPHSGFHSSLHAHSCMNSFLLVAVVPRSSSGFHVCQGVVLFVLDFIHILQSWIFLQKEHLSVRAGGARFPIIITVSFAKKSRYYNFLHLGEVICFHRPYDQTCFSTTLPYWSCDVDFECCMRAHEGGALAGWRNVELLDVPH